MTEEKAIERMKDLIHTYDFGIEIYGADGSEFKKDKNAIKTVLKLLKYKDKEIEDLKKSVDYTYEVYQDAGNKMFDYAEEIEKKDKIINLMAEQLTTPVHSKEWVIDYYKNKVEKENE